MFEPNPKLGLFPISKYNFELKNLIFDQFYVILKRSYKSPFKGYNDKTDTFPSECTVACD